MSEATVKPKRRGRPPKAKKEEAPREAKKSEEIEVNDDFVKATTIQSTGTIRIQPAKLKNERRYMIWMGTTEECPYWTVHAGGADFPRCNELLHWDKDGSVSNRERVLGKTLEITRTDIELIAKAVGKKVVRKEGARAFVLNADSASYRAKESDQPLGKFLYMKVVEDSMPNNWRGDTPETMV
tara:strand:- start:4736 stop:5284 length:549 start_codon:yes stop_codon:yes gene_type:complete